MEKFVSSCKGQEAINKIPKSSTELQNNMFSFHTEPPLQRINWIAVEGRTWLPLSLQVDAQVEAPRYSLHYVVVC